MATSVAIKDSCRENARIRRRKRVWRENRKRKSKEQLGWVQDKIDTSNTCHHPIRGVVFLSKCKTPIPKIPEIPTCDPSFAKADGDFH